MRRFKNSINISKIYLNSIMLYKGIYGFKSIGEIQSEAFISNFTNRINDIGIIWLSIKIRLKDTQILNWKPVNIIKTQILYFFNIKDNLQAKILTLTHSFEITY